MPVEQDQEEVEEEGHMIKYPIPTSLPLKIPAIR
jgi:hypothetical protein